MDFVIGQKLFVEKNSGKNGKQRPEKHFQTRGAVALQYFPSTRHRHDRLNIQQMIFGKKTFFERKKLSKENLMEKIKPMSGRKPEILQCKSTDVERKRQFRT